MAFPLFYATRQAVLCLIVSGPNYLVIIDEVVEEGAVARSKADAPEIDGQVYIDGATHLKIGDLVNVEREEVDDHDMWGCLLG